MANRALGPDARHDIGEIKRRLRAMDRKDLANALGKLGGDRNVVAHPGSLATEIVDVLAAHDWRDEQRWKDWSEVEKQLSSASEGNEGVGPVYFDMVEPTQQVSLHVQALEQRLQSLEVGRGAVMDRM